MKKVLALILALALTVVCFAGCDKKQTGSNGDVPTLIWYVPGDSQPDTPMVMEAANKIIEKEIGAKIDLKFISAGDFDEKMRLKMASGDDFDLCFTGYTNNFRKAAQMGGLEPLDELLKSTPDLVASMDQSFWDAATYEGVIYGVPNQQIIGVYYAPVSPKRPAEKYKLDVDSIKEYKDLEPFMEAVKNGEDGVFPWRNKNAYFTVGAKYEEFTLGIGFDRSQKKPKVVFIDEEQAFIDGMNLRNEWYNKGYIRQDVLSNTDDTTDYYAGKYAMNITTYKPGVEVNEAANIGEPVVVCKNIDMPYIKQSAVTSTLIGIGRNCKNKEKAIKFIELINTNKELYNLICFGIEGVHYDMTEDGFVKAKSDSKYKPEADWKFGNQFNALVREGAAADVWEQTKAQNDAAEVSPLLGFNVDRTNIESELSSLSTVRSQYGKAYFCGAKKVDKDYDAYIKRMYDAGLQTVIDEIQRQVDEFLASKK